MASFMSTLGRAFGMVGNTADMISTGVEHLNSRMQRYAANEQRLADDKSVVEFAQARVDLNQEMLDLTKKMDTIAQDASFSRAEQWFADLKKEIAGGDMAKFPTQTKAQAKSISVRKTKTE